MSYRLWRLSKTLALTVLFTYVIGCVLLNDASGQNSSAPQSAKPDFHQLSPHSMAIAPGGRWLAFGRSSSGAGAADLNTSLLVYDVLRSSIIQLGTYNYGSMNFGPRPVWSPNSEFLAYYAVENDALYLKVWDHQQRRFVSGGVPVDKAGVAELQRPQWTPDNRFVLCFSNRNPSRLWEEQEGNNYTARLRAELVGQRPAINGMTLLGTPALAPAIQSDYGVGSASQTIGPSRIAARQVVALDIKTGAVQTLAQGAEFVQIQISDDGTVGLVGVLDDSGNFLIYALPLPNSTSPTKPNQASTSGTIAAQPIGPDGLPLRLLFRSSAIESFQNFNLSPSGRYVAYLAEGSGDIVMVDLKTGSKTNLTAKVSTLVPDAPEAELQKLVGRFDLPLYKGKFGRDFSDVPVWTKDESALVVTRVIAQPIITAPRRVELWRVARVASVVRRLTDSTLSIASWANCVDRSRVNCVAGPEGAVVALVRKQVNSNDSVNSFAYAHIDATTGAVRIMREITELVVSEFQAARATGDAISVEESASRPQELAWITAASVRSLNILNPPPLSPTGRVQRLEWVSASGERLFGMLRLPADARDGERLPVVLSVYPGRRGLESSRHFDSGRYGPLHSRARFALLTPDLPVKFGSGRVCADFSRYATEALDAAAATGLVDPSRAGVIGISYGGYAVNCIITHTNRFRAAVSEAGPSDLASTHALGGRGEWIVTKSWQWETPDRIVAESPVYHLHKVKTPVLFVTGKTDLNNALQEYEMYFGLLALKQPAALVSYDNAGHGDYDRFPDFWPRVIRWFVTYLNSQ